MGGLHWIGHKQAVNVRLNHSAESPIHPHVVMHPLRFLCVFRLVRYLARSVLFRFRK